MRGETCLVPETMPVPWGWIWNLDHYLQLPLYETNAIPNYILNNLIPSDKYSYHILLTILLYANNIIIETTTNQNAEFWS